MFYPGIVEQNFKTSRKPEKKKSKTINTIRIFIEKCFINTDVSIFWQKRLRKHLGSFKPFNKLSFTLIMKIKKEQIYRMNNWKASPYFFSWFDFPYYF